MAQITGALHVAVASVFIGFWALISTFYCQRGGLYARQNYLCTNLS